MTILSTRFKAACSALVAGGLGLGLFFALGVKGSGFILSNRRNTSSSLEDFAMTTNPWDIQPLSKPDAQPSETYLSIGEALSEWAKIEGHLAMLFGFLAGNGPGLSVAGPKISSLPAI